MDTHIIMPMYVFDRGWAGFLSLKDVLDDRGLKPEQLHFLYQGWVTMAGLRCVVTTFAVLEATP